MGYARMPQNMQKPMAQPGDPATEMRGPMPPMGDMMGGGGMQPGTPFSMHNDGGGMVGQPMPSGAGGYDQIRQAMGAMSMPGAQGVGSLQQIRPGGGFPPTGGGDPMAMGPGQGPATMGPMAPQPPQRMPPQSMPPAGMSKPMQPPNPNKPPQGFAGGGPMVGQTGGGLQAQPMRRKQYDRGSTIKRADAQNGAKAKNLVAAASSYKKG